MVQVSWAGLQSKPKVKVAADKALALVALLTLSTVKLVNKARVSSRCLIAADSEHGEATVTLEKRVEWHLCYSGRQLFGCAWLWQRSSQWESQAPLPHAPLPHATSESCDNLQAWLL